MGTREFYSFGEALKEERLTGCEGKCECCGAETKLYGHHLIACFLASHNPVLTPMVIRSTENMIMLCHDCHKQADEQQISWDAPDIAMMAWALFDLDPKEVEESQGHTYAYRRRKKGKKKKRSRRSMKRY
ncbi:MAG: hypothetical protein OEX81_02495 [Candidatus Pacebacteria bacterium]|nr:hypothetical protein [Candidatus Paceibacterota bacterium]